MFCYAGVSLPVIGIGVLSAIETPGLAEKIFAAVIAAIALLAIDVDIHQSPRVLRAWSVSIADENYLKGRKGGNLEFKRAHWLMS